ncbi:short-chain dehydrogenase/reductase SDR family protein (plasmid) [Rhizobium etli]|uniref:Short-chain dehydrogenase/reductase SDR family protein n=1 Tax=Rhizobium etli TaxID=29449 RepID=A0AAN1BM79_RHIET|nr:SDR family NAD(P)-dependent oxidoreductase [Rhizobium etli]ARQ13834.1 short-chain dehydrogenase/reductase SDR family protein [Rhizobium etli]
MEQKMIALITGANSGLGKQMAKELAALDYIVLLGCRNFDSGKQAAEEIGDSAHTIHLDVTDGQSIAAAAARITTEFGRLDLLVNNAAIGQSGRYSSVGEVMAASRPSAASLDEIRVLFETNALGALAVTKALLPLIRESRSGRIVNVSSAAGSLTLNTDPNSTTRAYFGVTYALSKIALNAITVALAIELEDSGIKVRAASPAITATAINDFMGGETVEIGVRPLVAAALDIDSPTGSFTGPDGPIPW